MISGLSGQKQDLEKYAELVEKHIRSFIVSQKNPNDHLDFLSNIQSGAENQAITPEDPEKTPPKRQRQQTALMKESRDQEEEISPKPRKVAKKKAATKEPRPKSKKQLQKEGDASSALHSSIEILDDLPIFLDNFPPSSTETLPGAFTPQQQSSINPLPPNTPNRPPQVPLPQQNTPYRPPPVPVEPTQQNTPYRPPPVPVEPTQLNTPYRPPPVPVELTQSTLPQASSRSAISQSTLGDTAETFREALGIANSFGMDDPLDDFNIVMPPQQNSSSETAKRPSDDPFKVIDELKRENERLQKEIQDLRKSKSTCCHPGKCIK